MEAVLERKNTARKWVAPDHELSHEEFRDILDNFDYEGWLEEFDEDGEPEPIYDKYGNPTRDTFAAMYESEHDLCEPTTLEDLLAWVDSLQ